MVAAEDARGCTALHYACRTLAKSEHSASAVDRNLIKEGAEEARKAGQNCTDLGQSDENEDYGNGVAFMAI